MKDILKKVTECEEFVGQSTFEEWVQPGWWSQAGSLMRFLKKNIAPWTGGRKVVEATPEENGWEAWRRLKQHLASLHRAKVPNGVWPTV